MKCSSFAALFVVAVMVGTAQADIAVNVIRVTCDSGAPESEYADDIPEGFFSWQIVIDTDTKWIGAELDVFLDAGTIYYDPAGQPDRSPPNAALFDLFPSSRFSSHLSGTHIDPANGQRQSPGFAPNPVRPGRDKTYTDQTFISTWYTPDPLLEGPGQHIIGLITMSNDAEGTFVVRATDPERATQIDILTGEVTREADPFVFPGIIWRPDGRVPCVPEPSTALLAVLGLMGLVLGTARRRKRRA